MKFARFGPVFALCAGLAALAGLGFAGVSGTAAVVAARPKPALVSHKAIYNLSLVDQGNELGLLEANGQIAIEVTNLCGGFATNQRLITQMWPRSAPPVLSEVHLSSWESGDGNRFRFSAQDYLNEQPAPAIVGEGRRDEAQVLLSEPESDTQTLPEGTIFPSELTQDLVKAARSGARSLKRRVYEGSDTLEVFDIAAIIGDRQTASAEMPDAVAGLQGLSYWPVSISYYKYGDTSETPEYQVVFHLYENGVSASPVFDYGDFKLRGQIVNLSVADASECR